MTMTSLLMRAQPWVWHWDFAYSTLIRPTSETHDAQGQSSSEEIHVDKGQQNVLN